MKNSNHVNWLTVKVYLSDSIGQQTSIFDLLQFIFRPSSRLGLEAKFPPRKAWRQSSKWRSSKPLCTKNMGDRLKQIKEKSKLRRQILAQQVRNTCREIMRQQMYIVQCLNENYAPAGSSWFLPNRT